MKKDINQKALYSMIVGITASVLSFILPMNYLSGVIILVLGVVALVIYSLAKPELKKMKNEGKGKGKGQATAGLVLGVLNVVMGLMVFLVIYAINEPEIASQVYCVDTDLVSNCTTPSDDNGIVTCSYMGSVDIKCKKESLKEEQYNK